MNFLAMGDLMKGHTAWKGRMIRAGKKQKRRALLSRAIKQTGKLLRLRLREARLLRELKFKLHNELDSLG